MQICRYGLAIAASLTMLTGGCGPAAPEVATELALAKPGVNGGTAYPIPGDMGYAEVIVERTRPGQPVTLAVYFLDSSATQSIGTEPARVRARLVLPVDDQPEMEVVLTAKDKPGEGQGKRFVSPPGKFDYDELRGEIFVTLGGQDVVVPFAFR